MKHVVGKAMPKTVELTALIVAAYIRGNKVAGGDISDLIQNVDAALRTAIANNHPEEPRPAVPITESIRPDYLVCLEDGEEVTLLRRHLKNQYGMTPEDYRRKWKLPHDYPMVPALYSEQRAQNAILHGLGKG